MNRESLSRYRQDGTRGRDEWIEGNLKISVVNGYSSDYDAYTTDILVIPLDGSTKQKLHVIFDEDGNEIFNEWHD